jgi:hypothetical protein
MAEWSEDHVVVIGPLNLNFAIFDRIRLNWRPGEALRWKVEIVGWEGQEWYVANWYLQDCSPYLCRLSIDGSAPASKY